MLKQGIYYKMTTPFSKSVLEALILVSVHFWNISPLNDNSPEGRPNQSGLWLVNKSGQLSLTWVRIREGLKRPGF